MRKDWVYRRGDVYLADCGAWHGSIQGGIRPVVVVQNDTGNRHSPTLSVVKLTTKVKKKPGQPTHYVLKNIKGMVDEKKIAFNPAYELSFLKPEEQEMLIETMDYEQATPSLSQAQRLKQFSQEGHLTEDSMLAIMSEEKKPVQDKIMFTSDVLRKYFPKDYTPRKMEKTIIKLLEQWKQRRLQQQDQQRRHNSR
ncbi:MAG: type II toxin-antitoxin system PemK/MazF family toxin [Lachnospiraceae bacterium]|nr:type II toxin-antitoxin system PemK/MazF family toxin [Lachnospiraceae bacterium]